ncbi:MAG: 2-oxoacid:acceptor oxidoreductase subunit alpha [Deltaproteobacteria bacterium]|nr:MAG: 2-oxoacid:acceptor oxidoreductase subunit alpha [Deltaproteobacteria bacterium]
MGIDVNIRIAGGAGRGIHTAGNLVSRIAVSAGHHFHATQDYMSRIRGGRNSYTVRVADAPVRAGRERADILLALDPAHLPHFLPAVHPSGLAFSDLPPGDAPAGVLAVPLTEMAISAGSPILANVVGAGIVLRVLGVPIEAADRLLALDFRGDFLEKNRKAIRLGAEWAEGRVSGRYPLPEAAFHPRLIVSGNEALALGAVAGGCKFAAGYPMTPGSGVLHGLSVDGPPLGLVFEQAEDEIAALNMAIGASYAGARAMVATSGGGFALMVEALSLAGMLETPVVVVLGMRPGPATGMPTRTGQEELTFAISAGHGEFPRLVLSPGSVEEAYALAHHAMESAEAHQVPCILLSDQYLADTVVDADPDDFPVHPVRRRIVRGPDVPRNGEGRYLRYALTDDGISPMAVPGEAGITVVADSDEHTEDGHITEDHASRIRTVEKRARKEEGLAAETLPPLLSGPPDGEAAMIGFGSTKGVIAEAREILERDGVRVAAVHLRQVWPFPSEQIDAIVSRYGTAFTVENNRNGQLARLIRAETGRRVAGTVARFDGLPFTPEALAGEVKERIWAERSTRR